MRVLLCYKNIIIHRFHGEQQGMTEDAFVSATLGLSSVCIGGIDAQLSDVSSDYSFRSEEDEGAEGNGRFQSGGGEAKGWGR